MHSEFSKSSVCRANFKAITEEFLQGDWKEFYPILFSLTRWIYIQKCDGVVSQSPELFRQYAESLSQKNMDPRSFDPYKYRRRRGMADAAAAGTLHYSSSLQVLW